jgi:hypothetical protein
MIEPTREELLARIAELERSKSSGGIKVSAKGGVSVYGLGRFPITLYASQWDTLATKMPEITAFVDANRDKLATKAPKE